MPLSSKKKPDVASVTLASGFLLFSKLLLLPQLLGSKHGELDLIEQQAVFIRQLEASGQLQLSEIRHNAVGRAEPVFPLRRLELLVGSGIAKLRAVDRRGSRQQLAAEQALLVQRGWRLPAYPGEQMRGVVRP